MASFSEVSLKRREIRQIFVLSLFFGPWRDFLFFCDWSDCSELGFGMSQLPAAIAYTDQLS